MVAKFKTKDGSKNKPRDFNTVWEEAFDFAYKKNLLKWYFINFNFIEFINFGILVIFLKILYLIGYNLKF